MLSFLFGANRTRTLEQSMLEEFGIPIRSEAEKCALQFQSIYGFHPQGLPQERYRKEALIKLASLASATREKASELADYPGIFESSYQEAVGDYFEALEFLEYYDSEMVGKIPHWSELPNFLKGWLHGEKADFKSPTPQTKQLRRR
jgi:hypothetical protein